MYLYPIIQFKKKKIQANQSLELYNKPKYPYINIKFQEQNKVVEIYRYQLDNYMKSLKEKELGWIKD